MNDPTREALTRILNILDGNRVLDGEDDIRASVSVRDLQVVAEALKATYRFTDLVRNMVLGDGSLLQAALAENPFSPSQPSTAKGQKIFGPGGITRLPPGAACNNCTEYRTFQVDPETGAKTTYSVPRCGARIGLPPTYPDAVCSEWSDPR